MSLSRSREKWSDVSTEGDRSRRRSWGKRKMDDQEMLRSNQFDGKAAKGSVLIVETAVSPGESRFESSEELCTGSEGRVQQDPWV